MGTTQHHSKVCGVIGSSLASYEDSRQGLEVPDRRRWWITAKPCGGGSSRRRRHFAVDGLRTFTRGSHVAETQKSSGRMAARQCSALRFIGESPCRRAVY